MASQKGISLSVLQLFLQVEKKVLVATKVSCPLTRRQDDDDDVSSEEMLPKPEESQDLEGVEAIAGSSEVRCVSLNAV